jgi:S-DNA-T family DNA segregation ATPase FtsK/SpoIIIE
VAGRAQTPRPRKPAPAKATKGGRTPVKPAVKSPPADHMRELFALVLFGIAVFLIVILSMGDSGGFIGRGVKTGLVFAFGRLAFVVPATFVALGLTTVMQFRFWKSYRFAGVLVFLLGLFMLLAAAMPPFGHRAAEVFVRADFEGRAGGLGEALYALFERMVGLVGVAIIGWIALLAGFSLLTGITGYRVGSRTKQAAVAVKTSAERSALATRRRGEDTSAGLGAPLDEYLPKSSAARLGPVDLVGGAMSEQTVTERGTPAGAFGDGFDEWVGADVEAEAPTLSGAVTLPKSKSVLDGARAFADIYAAQGGEAGGQVLVPGEMSSGSASGGMGDPGPVAIGGMAQGDETHPEGRAEPDGESEDEIDAGQETLPGLAREPRQIELAVGEQVYLMPEPDLLRKSTPVAPGRTIGDKDLGAVLLQALAQFGVEAKIIGMVVGPRVTRYELYLAPGTKVAKVSGLKDDLAYALATTEIRILAPIPGKSAVGVEIPNQRPDFVTLGDIYREFPKSAGPLMVWLGKDISGKAVFADLSKLPHLLIAGTTGSGKSGCVNCLVSSVLLRSTPEQVRMIMIDPKKVELSHYDRIPHLLVPVVTNMKDAAGVLHNVVKEMEDRYELMELDHARSLPEMNKTRARRGERPVPYILVVIDELADLMMSSPQEVEDYVIRLAQKSRAVGIHLVVATQRPSADVITGMIKANIPSRIAFAVSSQTDSRVILDVNGAETLLGMGDMLFKPLGSSHLQRVQGAYITEEEIATLVNHWRHQAEPQFREELLRRPAEVKKSEDELFDPDSDELLADAARLVIETGSASVSMLQRRLRVGYTRAGRLIDMLERRGIVGPWEGSKPRQILIEPEEFEHVLSGLRSAEAFGDATSGV